MNPTNLPVRTDRILEEQMDNTEYREALGFLLGLTVGAVIGTATALLLAPQSGARTRRQIVRKAEEWTDSAGESLEDARDEARELADRAARGGARGRAPTVPATDSPKSSTRVGTVCVPDLTPR